MNKYTKTVNKQINEQHKNKQHIFNHIKTHLCGVLSLYMAPLAAVGSRSLLTNSSNSSVNNTYIHVYN